MKIEYLCNYDDFAEAHLGHTAARQRRGKAPRPWAGLAGWLVFVALAVVLVVLRNGDRAAGPARPPSPPVILPTGRVLVVRFLVASLPGLAYLAVFAVALFRSLVRPAALPWAPRPIGAGARIGRWLVVGAAVGVVTGLMLAVPRREGSDVIPDAYEFALSLFPWVAGSMILTVFGISHRHVTLRRGWEGQLFLHRPYTLEASGAGLTLEEPKSSHRYTWDYFTGFRETAGLLLLYVSPQGFWMVPKRAFATGEDLEAFKALLLTHVKEGTLLPVATGFPVLSPAAVQSIPVAAPGEGGGHG